MLSFGISIVELSGIVPGSIGSYDSAAIGITAKIQAIAPFLFSAGLDDDTILGLLTVLVVGAIAGFILTKAYVLLLFSAGWTMGAFYIALLDLSPGFSIAFTAILAIIYFSGYTQLKSNMGWEGIV